MKFFIAFTTCILLLLICLVFSCMGLYNTELNLRKQIEAQQLNNTNEFDVMWKSIKQSANVADKYKDGLKEVMMAYTEGRSVESDQLLVNWTKEAVPNIDSSIYKQLMNTIVASRKTFAREQKQLIDLNRQHDILIQKMPNAIFYNLMGIKSIDIQVVTSTKTQKTFETGKDDDVEL